MENFTDKLEKWVKQREKDQKKRRQDASTVEFLAVKKDVLEAITAGYSLKTIWEYLKERGQLRSTYETFRRHVKRHINTQDDHFLAAKKMVAPEAPAPEKQTKGQVENTTSDKGVAQAKEPIRPASSKAKSAKSGGFKYDAKPNTEDLI